MLQLRKKTRMSVWVRRMSTESLCGRMMMLLRQRQRPRRMLLSRCDERMRRVMMRFGEHAYSVVGRLLTG